MKRTIKKIENFTPKLKTKIRTTNPFSSGISIRKATRSNDNQ